MLPHTGLSWLMKVALQIRIRGRLKKTAPCILQGAVFNQDYCLAATPAVGTAAALAAIILKLQFGHHGRVGIMLALLGNVVFIIGHTYHQIGGEAGGFPRALDALQYFMAHWLSPRYGKPPALLWQ